MKGEVTRLLKDLGLNLIPCEPKSKKPSIPWKDFQNKKYTGVIPDSGNAAVICGRIKDCQPLVVIDIDSPELVNILFDDFERLKKTTLVVQTGSGGYHIYIKPRKEDPTTVRRLTNSKGQHMDIQGNGTYVVAPTSIHPNGNEYKIISEVTTIKEINLSAFIATTANYGFNTGGENRRSIEDIVKGIKKGDRNDSAFKYSCHLMDKVKLTPDQTWSELLRWNSTNVPPLIHEELKHVYESSLKYVGHEDKIVKELPHNKDEWIAFLRKHVGNDYNLDELNNKFILNVDSDAIQECIKRYPMTFFNIVTEALSSYGVNPKIQLSMTANTTIGKIRPDVGDSILCFECDVVAVDDKQTFTKKAQFECPKCQGERVLHCDERRIIDNQRCLNCKNRPELDIVEGTIESDYVQNIYVSETMEEAKHGTPQTMVCRLFGDVVGESYAGQRKKIIAQFKSLPKKGSRFNDVVLDAIDVISLDDRKIELPTDSELKEWRERVKKPDFFDKFSSECYNILNHEEIKKSLVLASIGAPKTPDTISNIHLLLLGDPGTAKTKLLEQTEKFINKSIFTGGKGNSAAGLAGGLDRPAPNMPMMFLPGVLTLASGGLAIIDEIDKMRDGDRDAVLLSMSQGYVPINKIRVHGKLPANTTILASANPKGGRWKSEKTILDQTELSEPLLSRFDLIWLVKDEINEYIDMGIAKHLTSQVNPSEVKIIDGEKIERFINYVKTLTPELTKEARDKITEYYVKIRQNSKQYGNLPIDPRKIVSLSKLAMAHARLLLKRETDVDSVNIVYDLFTKSLQSLDQDIEKGQTREKSTYLSREQREEQINETMVKLFGDLQQIDEKEFKEKMYTTTPASKFLKENAVIKLWHNWKNSGKLMENSDGTYRFEK